MNAARVPSHTAPGHLRVVLELLAAPVAAVLISLLIGSLIIISSGGSPLAAYAALFSGSLGSLSAVGRTLQNATPLILTGLAVAFAFRGGLFNIGGEGQFYIGAVTAAWLGVAVVLPAGLGIVVALIGAAVGGGAIAAVAGILKARSGAHEVITTIMLNFIAINLANWLLLNPLSAGTTFPGSDTVASVNALPALSAVTGNAHVGLLVALAAAAVAYGTLWRTPFGFEVRAVGLEPLAAVQAGVSIDARIVLTLALSGAAAGMAGAVEVLGTHGRMTVPFVTNLGFTGIGVALLGRNHPFGCVVGGIAFGALAAGGQRMQLATGIPLNLVSILTGLVLLFVTAERLVTGALSVRRTSAAPPGPRTVTPREETM